MKSIQNIITELQKFWLDHGCLLLPSYDFPKGAGTLNFNMLYNIINNNVYNTFSLETCRRFQDNFKSGIRKIIHNQVQVIYYDQHDQILELFIKSLEKLGINKKKHSIEFIEDNWSHQLINAKGYGWEVLCNKLEIAQITQFDIICGQSLKQKPFEFAYGIERIACILQNNNRIEDLMWNKKQKWSDVFNCLSVDYQIDSESIYQHLKRAKQYSENDNLREGYEECLLAYDKLNISFNKFDKMFMNDVFKISVDVINKLFSRRDG